MWDVTTTLIDLLLVRTAIVSHVASLMQDLRSSQSQGASIGALNYGPERLIPTATNHPLMIHLGLHFIRGMSCSAASTLTQLFCFFLPVAMWFTLVVPQLPSLLHTSSSRVILSSVPFWTMLETPPSLSYLPTPVVVSLQAAVPCARQEASWSHPITCTCSRALAKIDVRL